MTSKFLTASSGGAANLSDGTATIYGASLGATNLAPSLPVRTTASRQLTTGLLETSDINGLDTDLAKIGNFTGATQGPDITNMTGLLRGLTDPDDPQDAATRAYVLANSGAPAGTDSQTIRYDALNLPVANTVLTNDGATVGVGGLPTDAAASLELLATDKVLKLNQVPTGSLPAAAPGYVAYDSTTESFKAVQGVAPAATVVEQTINSDITPSSSAPVAQEYTNPPAGTVTNLQVYLSSGDGSTVRVGLSNNDITHVGYSAPVVVAPTAAGFYTIPIAADTVTAGVPFYVLILANTGTNVAIYTSSISFPTDPLPNQKLYISGGEQVGADLAYKITIAPAKVPTWGELASETALTAHTSDTAIHFTEGSIDHTAIQSIGTNSHAQIDTHIADATIHFTEASIDHTAIQNVGTNSHDQIDTHIANTAIHKTLLDEEKLSAINVSANLELPQLVTNKTEPANNIIAVAHARLNGKVYAGTAGSNTLYEYTMAQLGADYNPQELTSTSNHVAPGGTGNLIVPHPDGSHIYWCVNGQAAFAYDTAVSLTGGPAYTIPNTTSPNHIAFNSASTQAVVCESSGNRVNLYTVAIPAVSALSWTDTTFYWNGGSTSKNAAAWGQSVATQDFLYVARNDNSIDVLDSTLLDAGGAAGLIENKAVGGTCRRVTVTSDGLRLYAACSGAGVTRFDVNQTTGILENPLTFALGGIAYDSVEACGGATDPIVVCDGANQKLYTVDPTTMTPLNGTGLVVGGQAVDVSMTADCGTAFVAATAGKLAVVNFLTTIEAPKLEATDVLVVGGQTADITAYNSHLVDTTLHWGATGAYTAPAGNDLALTAPAGQDVTLTVPVGQSISLDAVSGNVVLNVAKATKITNLANGSDPNDAVNKFQLDAAAAGFDPNLLLVKQQCFISPAALDLQGWVGDTTDGVGHTLTAPATGANTFDGFLMTGLTNVRVLVQGTNGFEIVQGWGLGAGSIDGSWFVLDDGTDKYLYHFRDDGSASGPTSPPVYTTIDVPVQLPAAYDETDIAIAVEATLNGGAQAGKLTVVRAGSNIDIEMRGLVYNTAPLAPWYSTGGNMGSWLSGGAMTSSAHLYDNGIYTLSTFGDVGVKGVLTRATDADGDPSGEVATSNMVWVQNGTVNGGVSFIISRVGTTPGVIVPDVEDQYWVPFASTQAFDLGDLADVQVPAPTTDDRLAYDGANWVNATNNVADLTDASAAAPQVGDTFTYENSGLTSFSQLVEDADDTIGGLTSTYAQGIYIGQAVHVNSIAMRVKTNVGTGTISVGVSTTKDGYTGGLPAPESQVVGSGYSTVTQTVNATLQGQIYLVARVDALAGGATFGIASAAFNNPYQGGTAWTGLTQIPTRDAYFMVDTAPTLTWRNSTFAGQITAFGGQVLPNGWLRCNGASVLRSSYPRLWDAIGMSWGAVDQTHFNLPDLRGRFLRSQNEGSGVDPDAAARTASAAGGATGDRVGSVQPDAFEVHTHGVGWNREGTINFSAAGTFWAQNTPGIPQNAITTASGGNETRPVNAYVMYIIKT